MSTHRFFSKASFYDISTVLQAFCLTTIVVVCLTMYTFQSKRDFKSGGAILFSLLTVLIFGGFFQVISYILFLKFKDLGRPL